jgi:hypothetical protein
MLFHSGNPIPDKTCAQMLRESLRKLLLDQDEFMQLLEDC